jgi:hypothetical protein
MVRDNEAGFPLKCVFKFLRAASREINDIAAAAADEMVVMFGRARFEPAGVSSRLELA